MTYIKVRMSQTFVCFLMTMIGSVTFYDSVLLIVFSWCAHPVFNEIDITVVIATTACLFSYDDRSSKKKYLKNTAEEKWNILCLGINNNEMSVCSWVHISNDNKAFACHTEIFVYTILTNTNRWFSPEHCYDIECLHVCKQTGRWTSWSWWKQFKNFPCDLIQSCHVPNE